MHRHSPLMRSLLSQFQTPTAPHRAVGFFGSGCPTGCPARRITQSTSDWLILFEPILSIVDTKNPSPPLRALSMPVISAVSDLYQYGFTSPRDSPAAACARFPQHESRGSLTSNA